MGNNVNLVARAALLGLLIQAILHSPPLAAADHQAQFIDTCRSIASTYFGGSSSENSWPSTPSTLDADGNVLFAIGTTSSGLASGGYDLSYNGGGDVLVVKMDADLTQVLSATYLGGAALESADELYTDDAGRVYICGSTSSANFPMTPGAYDQTHSSAEDAFVAVLSAGLDTLLASTFIGGNQYDIQCAMSVSTDGSIFTAFRTASTDLPTSPGAVQSSHSLAGADFYLIRLNSSLTTALASTYLGGNGDDLRPKLAIDGDGDVYCAGTTYSSNLPVGQGAYDIQNEDGSLDAFIFHISKALDTILASTYVGGNGHDWSYSIMLDENKDVYITGHASADWPTTPGCFDSTYGGNSEWGDEAYLSRLGGDLTTLKASTFLGGGAWDWGVDMARDSEGYIYVVGETTSPDFPATRGTCDSTCCDTTDMFVAKFDSMMQTLHLSTFIGGSGEDRWPGVLTATDDSVYIIGYTESADLSTTAGAYDGTYNGGGDMYAVKFSFRPPDQPNFICGDVDGSGVINILDVAALISYLYRGGQAPDPEWVGNANGEGGINILDVGYLVNFIYREGPDPTCQ